MKNYKLHVSDGFKDVSGYEMLVRREIENRVLDLFKYHGFELIKTPGVEYLDVYTLGESQKTDLYNLINRHGEVLALRNDMTSSVARHVCSNKNLKSNVLKYSYCEDLYRYPRDYQGKNHQFLQAGVELVGDDSMESDIFSIYLASKVLSACNCKDYTINIGSSLFLKELFNDFNLSEELKNAIYLSIENKDYVTLREVLNKNVDKEKADFILDLMMRGGKLKYIDSLMKKLEGMNACKVLEYLKSVYETLLKLNVENIIFDFSIYSYAEYYTGIIFNVYLGNISECVISGGRCDSLFKSYGKDLANVGFGVNIDYMTQYSLNNKSIEVKDEKYLSISDSSSYVMALENNEKFVNDGIVVNHVNMNLAQALEYAKANGFTKIIEYTNSSVVIKEVK